METCASDIIFGILFGNVANYFLKQCNNNYNILRDNQPYIELFLYMFNCYLDSNCIVLLIDIYIYIYLYSASHGVGLSQTEALSVHIS